jgi:LPXTG-motif cell wall-anchored protein
MPKTGGTRALLLAFGGIIALTLAVLFVSKMRENISPQPAFKGCHPRKSWISQMKIDPSGNNLYQTCTARDGTPGYRKIPMSQSDTAFHMQGDQNLAL